ncbi:urease accessory protein UreE [Ancylobacter sp. 6x-1]|uniref:Urease accessory protein UreE n=1 Tax=Ancylobacter crimeensis TaxID=2579147 RepID=A0ABT0D6F8_9HYPH|nr:urease accessory protein UreE [Ancylobacter crimeensis]MCK0195533.1 urease accessory protein UreE [Ancylobacter crimeensis]
MIHARTLLPAGTWDPSTAADRVVLPHDGRHRRRIAMRGEGDVAFLLDFPETVRLKDGDGLQLDDGRIVAVVAAAEPVAEIVARDAHHLARLAWHLGNRHVSAQFLTDRIRIARDSVLEEMVRGLSAEVAIVEAAFEPEGGAYEQADAHGHGHRHGHDHHAHEHGEACGCGHDHHDHAHGHDHPGHEHAGHGHDHNEHGHHGHAHHVHDHEDHAHHEHGPDCGCGHDHAHGEHHHVHVGKDEPHHHGGHGHDAHAHEDHGHHHGHAHKHG